MVHVIIILMFYLAHAGHEHPTEVGYKGVAIIAAVVIFLLIITIAGFYLKNRSKNDDQK